MLKPVRTIAPAARILTADDAMAHTRSDSSFDSSYFNSLILAVEQYLDGWTGILNICLITQTWTISWDSFPWQVWHGSERSALRGWPVPPSSVIRIPLAPIQSVSSVTYYDTNNVQQTLSAANYGVYTDDEGTFIQLVPSQSWPVTYQRPDAVTVTVVAGYGADSATVPAPILHAAKMLLTNWYENRMAIGQSTDEVDALLSAYKRNWVH